MLRVVFFRFPLQPPTAAFAHLHHATWRSRMHAVSSSAFLLRRNGFIHHFLLLWLNERRDDRVSCCLRSQSRCVFTSAFSTHHTRPSPLDNIQYQQPIWKSICVCSGYREARNNSYLNALENRSFHLHNRFILDIQLDESERLLGKQTKQIRERHHSLSAKWKSTSCVAVWSDLLERQRIRFLARANISVSDRRQLDGSTNMVLPEETGDDASENGAIDSAGEHHAETT